jgi:hypothetical protein
VSIQGDDQCGLRDQGRGTYSSVDSLRRGEALVVRRHLRLHLLRLLQDRLLLLLLLLSRHALELDAQLASHDVEPLQGRHHRVDVHIAIVLDERHALESATARLVVDVADLLGLGLKGILMMLMIMRFPCAAI